ncbi:hypothetical protein KUTeg_003666 [Tegillarca granosa]|uniref:DNA repair and recombination protein RAD54B n=1 Tax=Tegillarca granosa TaxID=220873 RepID=A0ABQ9FMT1_TEGGR|nr:hypothetical protein KUTeg_003666 [Tegillarca granosa]
MRRSAAPSSLGNPAKRPKFCVPFKSPIQSICSSNIMEKDIKKPLLDQTHKDSVNDIPKDTNVRESSTALICAPQVTEKEPNTTESTLSSSSVNNSQQQNTNKDRVHKKWEGDAILITCGRSVTLLDMEGKEIGKGTGYKSTELETLKEDETLFVGGKEIQIMSILNEEMFKSGKCFSSAGQMVTETLETQKETLTSKPFVNPHKDKQQTVNVVKNVSVTPRYDPSAPDALVMPRPSPGHQWQNNKNSLPLVDVVVDPYLSIHLRPHQRDGIKFLYECIMGYRDIAGQGAILATLYKQGPYGGKPVIKQALIITPGSLVRNWHQEFKKWLGTERLSVYAVSSDKRVEEFSLTTIYPVLIISYEMFVRAYDIIQKLKFDVVICDEGHRLKNTVIKTTSLIMSLPTRRRIVLSGTPIQNDLQEFYSIVEFCNPGILGTSAAFRRVYEGPIVASRQPDATKEEIELGEDRATELARLTKLFVLRRTQEINNQYLPPKCEIVLFCRPSPLQQLLCCRMIKSCLMGQFDGSPHLICIGALKQLCNHPGLIYPKIKKAEQSSEDTDELVYKGLSEYYPADFNTDSYLLQHSGKLVVLAALLDELHSTNPSEKIVLVSNQTKTLDILQKFCEEKDYKYLRLDGQTPTNRRQELVNRFNIVFLLSSKAGGVGLNLVGASRLVLYDIDWNPANDLQAMARVWRDGQKKQVYIYRFLTTGTIEEKIYQRQISKQGLSGAVIDARDTNEVQFSQEDLKDLFTMNEITDCDTHDLLSCTCRSGNDNQAEITELGPVRSCQLGVLKITQEKKKNLSMDELMSWKHISGEEACKHSDWFLSSAAGNKKQIAVTLNRLIKNKHRLE